MLESISKSSLAAALCVAGVVGLGGGAGLLSIVNLSDALKESQRTSHLLQAHQTADMMHDALRADALAAIVAGQPGASISIQDVEADLHAHLEEFRAMI